MDLENGVNHANSGMKEFWVETEVDHQIRPENCTILNCRCHRIPLTLGGPFLNTLIFNKVA